MGCWSCCGASRCRRGASPRSAGARHRRASVDLAARVGRASGSRPCARRRGAGAVRGPGARRRPGLRGGDGRAGLRGHRRVPAVDPRDAPALPPGTTPARWRASFAKTTRQRIRAAERVGTTVRIDDTGERLPRLRGAARGARRRPGHRDAPGAGLPRGLATAARCGPGAAATSRSTRVSCWAGCSSSCRAACTRHRVLGGRRDAPARAAGHDAPGALDGHPGGARGGRDRHRAGRRGPAGASRATRSPDDPNHGLYMHKASFGAVWVVREPARRIVLRPWADRSARLSREAVDRGSGRSVDADEHAPRPRSTGCAVTMPRGTRSSPPSPEGFHLQQTGVGRDQAPQRLGVGARGGGRRVGPHRRAGAGPTTGPGPFALGYAPRGPVATTWDEASVRGVQRRAPAHRAPAAPDPRDRRPGTEDRRGRGAARGRAAGAPPTPSSTTRSRVVDLPPGEDALWGELRSKWRQYVQQGAPRRRRSWWRAVAPTCRRSTRILVDTARRTGFFHRTLASYEAVWDAFAPSGAASLLLAPDDGGDPVAALFLVRCGGRVSEPYGGMTDAGAEQPRQLPAQVGGDPPRRRGRAPTLYDMWGLAHPGIEQFKAGLRRARGALRRRLRPGHAAAAARRAGPRAPRVWVAAARRRLDAARGQGPGDATPPTTRRARLATRSAA